jgi:bifunctional DNase/RNase
MAEIEMVIDSIREGVNINQEHFSVVILKEKEAERYLPIIIGATELESTFLSESIVMGQRGIIMERPITHDFVCTVIVALEATVKAAVISDLKNDVFYAEVILTMKNKQRRIDCRPGDALAVALRLHAPIFANEKVLNKAGIRLDPETGKPIIEG